MKILVITQKPGNLELADLVLQIPGHHVSLASSAEQAICFLQSAHPGLILLDLRLPRRGGVGLVRRFSPKPRRPPNPPVVVDGSPPFLHSKGFLCARYPAPVLG